MNEALHQFVIHFREPATTAELWAELALMETWCDDKTLPGTFADLERELVKLEQQGYLACDGGLWRPVRKVEAKQRQGALWA